MPGIQIHSRDSSAASFAPLLDRSAVDSSPERGTPSSLPSPISEKPLIINAPARQESLLGLALHGAALIAIYSTYGVLQEKVMKSEYGPDKERFTASSVLVLCNRLLSCLVGLTITLWPTGSSQHVYAPNESVWDKIKPTSPIHAYLAVALCNFAATFCQYDALRHVGFTTQSIAKCTKMVPVLLVGALVYRKTYKTREWIAGAVVLAGSVAYAVSSPGKAGHAKAHGDGNTILGGLLLLGYLFFDALTSTTQETVFGKTPAAAKANPFAKGGPVLTQMVWVNAWAALIALLVCLGALSTTVGHSIWLMMRTPALMIDIALLSATATTGLLVLFNTIAVYGALTSAMLMTCRQFFSILLNAFLFSTFTQVGLLGWAGVGLVASGVWIKLDKRFDDDGSVPPEFGTMRARRSKPSLLKQYAAPLCVPLLFGFIASISTSHISAGRLGTQDVSLSGGAWESQFYSAMKPTNCEALERPAVRHPDLANLPKTVFASFPRSGNSWTRSLVERTTGFTTSALYCDRMLATAFTDECSGRNNSFFVKSHEPLFIHGHGRQYDNLTAAAEHWKYYDRAVRVVRNPLDSIHSLWHFTNTPFTPEKHTSRKAEFTTFNMREHWRSLAFLANQYKMHSAYWTLAPIPQLLMRYEDLHDSPLTTTSSLVNFLLPDGQRPSLETIACALEQTPSKHEAYKSRKSGNFATWDIYEPDVRERLLQLLAPQWCQYGYNVLFMQERGYKPVDCSAIQRPLPADVEREQYYAVPSAAL
ncbi:uncharacterized protein L969DRAFT_25894 [Mixia osmundae IAM 14324]|uniref:Sulfotransferase domain-containing protein n=1 Tax=Mixia osmundae (strain CBS 9802 / IAM 14324 / JCM 22182 / KY 12970) TaxID=764103 RepID=G7DUR1_MIXOS|nr:uncharacterized protein L969DRAFT_25894 [Mixia osmundae IAM 14324]KEI37463.1 hypothetical protein L969DRAFT_25894 [Mixia osmundae IAM 14324]GAA94321.1 hypothetical protein E5Q_00971 [Mixia osmundae IAM 14324]